MAKNNNNTYYDDEIDTFQKIKNRGAKKKKQPHKKVKPREKVRAQKYS